MKTSCLVTVASNSHLNNGKLCLKQFRTMYCKLSAKSEATAAWRGREPRNHVLFCGRQQSGLEKHMYVIKALNKKFHRSARSDGISCIPPLLQTERKTLAPTESKESILGDVRECGKKCASCVQCDKQVQKHKGAGDVKVYV